jgi:hypothetical protein
MEQNSSFLFFGMYEYQCWLLLAEEKARNDWRPVTNCVQPCFGDLIHVCVRIGQFSGSLCFFWYSSTRYGTVRSLPTPGMYRT